jgi:hypothetical protein
MGELFGSFRNGCHALQCSASEHCGVEIHMVCKHGHELQTHVHFTTRMQYRSLILWAGERSHIDRGAQLSKSCSSSGHAWPRWLLPLCRSAWSIWVPQYFHASWGSILASLISVHRSVEFCRRQQPWYQRAAGATQNEISDNE